ncbi:hypothetical protein ACP70R_021768 [Stipagrostis hirtigluma subsp. patula]
MELLIMAAADLATLLEQLALVSSCHYYTIRSLYQRNISRLSNARRSRTRWSSCRGGPTWSWV